MRRLYTRNKNVPRDQYKIRNIGIIVIVIAGTTTGILLAVFWPKSTGSNTSYMSGNDANAFLVHNWQPPVLEVIGIISQVPLFRETVHDQNFYVVTAFGVDADAIYANQSWIDKGMAKGVCLIFMNANLTRTSGHNNAMVNPLNGVAIIGLLPNMFNINFQGPQIVYLSAGNLNQTKLAEAGYTIKVV